MKCECKGYCDGDKATMICKDCRRLYCKKCASCEDFLCDCVEPQNIVDLESKDGKCAKLHRFELNMKINRNGE